MYSNGLFLAMVNKETLRNTLIKVAFLTFLLLLLSSLAAQIPNPVRMAEAKPGEFPADIWPLDRIAGDDLNVTPVAILNLTTENGVNYTEERFYYTSTEYEGKLVRIYAEFLHPSNATGYPAILIMHGYGHNHTDMKPLARKFVEWGWGALILDAPDRGNSTPYPSMEPESILNTVPSPTNSYFYQVAYACMRGVTFLYSRSDVDHTRIGMTGFSMGGYVTYISAAVDRRISAAMPFIATGNVLDSIFTGSFTNFMVPPFVGPDDPEVRDFLRYLDPINYAPNITQPILIAIGTNDEFFTIHGLMDTYAALGSSEKYISLVPNVGHTFTPVWLNTTRAFFNHVFWGEPFPVSPELSVSTSPFSVRVKTINADHVVYRDSFPGSGWQTVDTQGEVYIYPFGRKVTLYAVTYVNGVWVSTEPIEVEVYGASMPLIIASIGVLAYLLFLIRPKIAPVDTLPLALTLLGTSFLWAGFWNRSMPGILMLADRYYAPAVAFMTLAVYVLYVFSVLLMRDRRGRIAVSAVPAGATLFFILVFYTLAGEAYILPGPGGVATIVSPAIEVILWRREKNLRQ